MLERLQKIIARAGIASRRHAEQLIRSGQVTVNGAVVTELGAKADPERDRVEAAGKVAERPAESHSYVLYKPVHVVSTMFDPAGRATLRHVLRGLRAAVFPVGGLDYSASGLMLLTSDGELADRVFKSMSRIPQVYWIKVAGRPSEDLLTRIRRRAHVRMRRLAGPAAARDRNIENPWYEVEFTQGRNDTLREAFFAGGHPIEKMKRVRLGPLDLGDLREGHFRELAPSEVARLQRAVESPPAGHGSRPKGAHGSQPKAAYGLQPKPAHGFQPKEAARPPRTGAPRPLFQPAYSESKRGLPPPNRRKRFQNKKSGKTAGQNRGQNGGQNRGQSGVQHRGHSRDQNRGKARGPNFGQSGGENRGHNGGQSRRQTGHQNRGQSGQNRGQNRSQSFGQNPGQNPGQNRGHGRDQKCGQSGGKNRGQNRSQSPKNYGGRKR